MKRTLITTLAFLMIATIAAANGGEHASPGGNDFGRAGADAIVGSDGTVFITRTVVDTGTRTATTTVTAIRPTGTTAWTITLSTHGNLRLSGSNLISLSETRADRVVTSTLTAYSTATGTTAWTRAINGEVQELLPFSGGTYALVVVPATTAGGTATRSLVAIGNDGSVLWTVSL
jgi:outer membrane protein assembly factor BamB